MTTIHMDDVALLDALMDSNRLANGWQDFLDKLLEHFNLRHVNLYMFNPKDFSPRFQEWSGIAPSPEMIQDYMDNYFIHDKVHHTMLASPECTWVTGNFEPYQSMLNEMPNFHEWTKKHDFPYTTGCVLHRDENGLVAMTFQRGNAQGPFTHEEEKRFTILSKYISKAISLRLKLSEKGKDDLRLKAVLNKMKFPVSAVNEFGEVIVHNDLMITLLANQKSISVQKDKHFLIDDTNKNLSLQRSVVNSISSAKELGETYDSGSVQLYDSNGAVKLSISSCELIEKDEDAGSVFVGALIYAVSPDLIRPVNKSQLKSLFNLTESEAQVCYLFAKNHSLKEIAEIEVKSINTAREQLQNAYKKTNSKGQLELINLLASLPSVA